MKIAYLLLAHDNPSHLLRLTQALRSPDNHCFVHVDAKTPLEPFAMVLAQPDVTAVQDRVRVRWGGFSLLRATLDLLTLAYHDDREFDYYVLLSGSDYPIRSNDYIKDFFASGDVEAYIDAFEMPSEEFGKPLWRLTRYQFEVDHASYNVGHRVLKQVNKALRRFGPERDFGKHFDGRKPYGGSTWWSLSATAAGVVLETAEESAGFLKFYEHTSVPDEMFYQTVLMNSPLRDSVVLTGTYCVWQPGRASPEILKSEHIDELEAMIAEEGDPAPGDHRWLFARKFRDDSAPLIAHIDETLRA